MRGTAGGSLDKSFLVLPKKLFCVLNKADDDDYCGAGEADKEHGYEQPHCKDGQKHTNIVACFKLLTPSGLLELKVFYALPEASAPAAGALPNTNAAFFTISCARNAINSTLYAAKNMEIVGWRGAFIRSA